MATEGMSIYLALVRFSPDRLWICTPDILLLTGAECQFPLPCLEDMDLAYSLFTITAEWRPF